MSDESRFYAMVVYRCPICQTDLRWVKRADQDDSMVLLHGRGGPCRLEGRAFYPPVVNMTEIKGAINALGQFEIDWEAKRGNDR